MNILQQYLQGRAARGNPPRNPIMNDAPQVTRAEFNTLARAVEGLVQDVEAALSPEQLGKALNAALEPLVNGAAPRTNGHRPPLALPAERHTYLAPAGDDDGLQTNNRGGVRKPLALKADNAFLAPKGGE